MAVTTFVIACVLFSLSPGSGAALSVNNVLVNGLRGASFCILGLQAALALHLVLVYLGIGVLVSQSPLLYNAIKYAGVAYLVYLGVAKIISSLKGDASLQMDIRQQGKLSLVKQGLSVNLTNPKSIIFLSAFLPQFVDIHAHQALQYLLLGSIVLLVDGSTMLLYSLGAHAFKRYLANGQVIRTINGVFGGLFIAIAASIAL